MIEFIQKEFNKRTKSKRKANRTKTNVVMHTNRGGKKAIEALAEVDKGNLERAEELNNQAKRLQQTAKGEAAKLEGQVRDLAKNTTENANGVKNITIGNSKVKVDSDSVRIVGKPQGNRTAVTVSEGDIDIHRKTGKGATVNTRPANTDTITHYVDNQIKQKTNVAKPFQVVGQSPKVEQKAAQVAEEVVAHKPAAPTMEQIAKEGADDVKKVTKGLGKWSKRGLIAAGTVAVGSGLAYGGKKLYDKKKAKEASYSEKTEKKQSGLTKSGKWGMGLGAATGAGALGYSTAKGVQLGREIGKEAIDKAINNPDELNKFMESKMKDAMKPGGKFAKAARRGNIGLAVGAGLAATGALAYGAGKIRDRKMNS